MFPVQKHDRVVVRVIMSVVSVVRVASVVNVWLSPALFPCFLSHFHQCLPPSYHLPFLCFPYIIITTVYLPLIPFPFSVSHLSLSPLFPSLLSPSLSLFSTSHYHHCFPASCHLSFLCFPYIIITTVSLPLNSLPLLLLTYTAKESKWAVCETRHPCGPDTSPLSNLTLDMRKRRGGEGGEE